MSSDSHDHHTPHHKDSTWKLAIVAFLNIVGFIIELTGGLMFGSVSLLSDAVHMLFDALAYLMAFFASAIAEEYNASNQWSFGLHRLEPLSAFLNGVFLFPMVGYILFEAIQRFQTPVPIGTTETILIAIGGLLINVFSVFILEGDDMSLNEKGAFYHLIADAGGSIAVIISASIVQLTGINIIDPIIAGIIAIVVLWSAVKILIGSGAIFLHKNPISHEEVHKDIAEIEGVVSIDNLHTWKICSEITIATAHIRIDVDTLEESEKIQDDIHRQLMDFGIDYATIEVYTMSRDEQLNKMAHH